MPRKKTQSDAIAFVDFISAFQNNLARSRGAPPPPAKIVADFPEVVNLFATFPQTSVYEPESGRPQEWNPFSQRPIFTKVGIKTEQSLVNDIAGASSAIDAFIDTTHEMIHVLLWEPFFVGRQSISSATNFLELSLLYEGFDFWYTDMKLTRSIRVRLADGEFVRTRSAMSRSPKKFIEVSYTSAPSTITGLTGSVAQGR